MRAPDAMHTGFLTHLDAFPRHSSAGTADRASIRCALLRESAELSSRIHPESRSLLDPTLLEGASVEAVVNSGARIVLDLSLNAPTGDADGNLAWGGPIRLVAEGGAELTRSDPDAREPDPKDPIVWSELRIRSLDPNDGIEFILVFASDRRWRISAKTIRFATLPIPS
ncbi:MAG: hypothetical protein NXI14_14460 [bacterium]|nr:hypothetical protein [bacterium]